MSWKNARAYFECGSSNNATLTHSTSVLSQQRLLKTTELSLSAWLSQRVQCVQNGDAEIKSENKV